VWARLNAHAHMGNAWAKLREKGGRRPELANDVDSKQDEDPIASLTDGQLEEFREASVPQLCACLAPVSWLCLDSMLNLCSPQAFAKYDTNGGGSIDAAELTELMASMGSRPTEKVDAITAHCTCPRLAMPCALLTSAICSPRQYSTSRSSALVLACWSVAN
jgi:hypothetical protein